MQRGFTLIELLVVVAIVAVIGAGVAVYYGREAVDDAKKQMTLHEMAQIRDAFARFWADNSSQIMQGMTVANYDTPLPNGDFAFAASDDQTYSSARSVERQRIYGAMQSFERHGLWPLMQKTNRANMERAVREGEGLRDALTRREGLNLACDMGMDPGDFAPGELGLAVTRTFRINERRKADGTLDADNPGDLRHAPIFKEFALIDLKNSVTNHAAEIAVLNNLLIERQSISNEWAAVKIGAGWRGPYCTAVRQDAETRLVRDPYGGFWDAKRLDDGSGAFGVVCYGGDSLPDADAYANTNDWRAVDTVVRVCPTNSAVSLQVELSLPEDASGTVRLYCIAPRLDASAVDANLVCSMRGRLAYSEWAASGASSARVVSGELRAGVWAVFACMTDGSARFATSVSTLHLYAGTNNLRMDLREIQN